MIAAVKNAGEVIVSERAKRGLQQEDLAALSGVSRQQISRYERGLARPNAKTLGLIARALGIDETDFVRRCKDEGEGRPLHVSAYRSPPGTGLRVIEFASAGPAVERYDPGDEHHERIPIDAQAVGDPDAFAIRLDGDSMEPIYRHGEIVVVAPSAVTEDGDDCFVQFTGGDERNTFKTVLRLPGGGLKLIPRNRAAAPVSIVTPDEFESYNVRLSKAVGVYRFLKWARNPEWQG